MSEHVMPQCKPQLNPDDVLALIESRQSVGHLVEPAPSQAELEQAIQAAISAPDHHRLRPWQFLHIQGQARNQLGETYVECLKALGVTEPAQLERALAQPLRAPLILVAVVKTQQHPKVPVVEQILSMGAAVENLLLMLNAQGYASIWRSGALTESALLKTKLGLKADDEIAGFIYIGTAVRQLPPRERLDIQDFLSSWPSDAPVEPTQHL